MHTFLTSTGTILYVAGVRAALKMPAAAKMCTMANAASQSGVLEAVGPSVFARVQESKGASGPIHEIEIVAKSLGCF